MCNITINQFNIVESFITLKNLISEYFFFIKLCSFGLFYFHKYFGKKKHFSTRLTPDTVPPCKKSDTQHGVRYATCVSYALKYRHDFPSYQINRQHGSEKSQKCKDLKLCYVLYHQIIKLLISFVFFDVVSTY